VHPLTIKPIAFAYPSGWTIDEPAGIITSPQLPVRVDYGVGAMQVGFDEGWRLMDSTAVTLTWWLRRGL
jgi:hypothetical protein